MAESDRPKRRRLNLAGKRALRAAELRTFVNEYARKAYPTIDPNDRGYDRELEAKVKRMRPEDLDRLMRDDEE